MSSEHEQSVNIDAELIEVDHEVETVFIDTNLEEDDELNTELVESHESDSDLDSEYSHITGDNDVHIDKSKANANKQQLIDDSNDNHTHSDDEDTLLSTDEINPIAITNKVSDTIIDAPTINKKDLATESDQLTEDLSKTSDNASKKVTIDDKVESSKEVVVNKSIALEENEYSSSDEESDADDKLYKSKDTEEEDSTDDEEEEISRITDNEAVQEPIINKNTNESVLKNNQNVTKTKENDTDLDTTSESLTKPSRELKLLLELSKESNLDINIGHKRKSADTSRSEDSDGRDTPGKRTMRSQNPEFVAKHQKFLSKVVVDESKTEKIEKVEEILVPKRKRDSLHEKSAGGAADVTRTRKIMKINRKSLVKNGKDVFCWRCHKDYADISCETCPRSYHAKCLKHYIVADREHWPCPECVSIWKAESTKTRPASMKDMTLDHLCGLLKFALKRMVQIPDSTHFMKPVNEKEFPDYKNYILQPMDLTKLEKNINANLYGSPNAFEADAKWILHNSIVFNSYQSKLTTAAKLIVKVCKQEMSEIENCSNCYLNANTKKDWFVEVCPKPHILLWAKLKGFPYWPAKSMCYNNINMVDVRFFGAHDRAWVSFKDCFLYSEKNPNPNQSKKNDINECVKEVNIYIENLKKVYGDFKFAPFRMQFDPTLELKYIQTFLPKYKPIAALAENKKLSKSTMSLEQSFLNDTEEKSMVADEAGNNESKSDDKLGFMDEDEDISVKHITGDDDVVEPAAVDADSLPLFRLFNKVSSSTPKKRNSTDKTVKQLRRDSNVSLKSNTSRLSIDAQITDEGANKAKPKISDKLIRKLNETIEDEETSTIKPSEIVGEEKPEEKTDGKVLDKDSEELNKILKEGKEIIKFKIQNQSKLDSNKNKESPKEIVLTFVGNNKETTTLNRVPKGQEKTYQNKKLSEPIIKDDKSTKSIPIKEESQENKEDKPKESEYEENDLLQVLYSESVEENKVDNESTKKVDELKKVFRPIIKKVDVGEKKDLKKLTLSKKNDAKKITEDILNKLKEPGKKLDNNEAMVILNRDYRGKDQAEYKKNEQKIDSLLKSKTPEVVNKKRRLSVESKENDTPIKKTLRVLTVGDLGESSNNYVSISSILAKEKIKVGNQNVEFNPKMDIKSEPQSDDNEDSEISENEYMEAKLKLLSALNISEKRPLDPKAANKAHEIRTRSKTEEKHNKSINKAIDNISVCIDNVASPPPSEIGQKKRKSATIKQRARKTFPNSKLNQIQLKQVQVNAKRIISKETPITSSPPVEKVVIAPQTSIVTQPPNLMFFSQSQPMVNNLVGLQNQLTYTTGSPFLTMMPNTGQHPYGNFYLQTNQPMLPSNLTLNSVIPQSTEQIQVPDILEVSTVDSDHDPKSRTPLPKPTIQKQITLQKPTQLPTSIKIVPKSVPNGLAPSTHLHAPPPLTSHNEQAESINLDEFNVLQGLLPQTIAKNMADLLSHGPPKLKPRPPGPLTTHYEEGTSSLAGPVTASINSIAHRLTDYFRGMLIETLSDVGKADNVEATITQLRLENEQLKHKHNEEILEIKKNVNTILKDIQKSILEEKDKVLQETKATCELEAIKRVEETKAKQWCANCLNEAQFYCCWNTSYCDYPCQTKHWPKHMTKCSQHSGGAGGSSNQQGPSLSKSTPIVLRQTAPPKGVSKAMMAKSTKVMVNRGNTKVPVNLVRAGPNKNHITLVESGPGNYELVGSGPISIDSRSNITKLMSNPAILNKIKNGSVITVSSPNSEAPNASKSFTLQKGQMTTTSPSKNATNSPNVDAIL